MCNWPQSSTYRRLWLVRWKAYTMAAEVAHRWWQWWCWPWWQWWWWPCCGCGDDHAELYTFSNTQTYRRLSKSMCNNILGRLFWLRHTCRLEFLLQFILNFIHRRRSGTISGYCSHLLGTINSSGKSKTRCKATNCRYYRPLLVCYANQLFCTEMVTINYETSFAPESCGSCRQCQSRLYPNHLKR